MISEAGRAALVVGASGEIGGELVRQLVERPDVARVFAACRDPERSRPLAALERRHPDAIARIAIDLCDERSIARAAEKVAGGCGRLHLLVNAAGLLHEGDALRPEKKLDHVDPTALRRVFEVNAFGPLLVAKHFRELLRHDERAVLANLSARVGSIGDDRAGGWYAYRASKAALNLFTRNLAIELGRRAPQLICLALHPGTVDTALSRPFQRNVPAEKLFSPERAARNLLAVIDALEPEHSGSFLAWDSSPIPW